MANPTAAWPRAAFGEFLAARNAVAPARVKFYQYWVTLFLNRPGPADRAADMADDEPEVLACFLEGLGREREAWQVKQAQEAIRLYLYFRSTRPCDPEDTDGHGAPESAPRDAAAWQEAERELVRILRLKHLAMATERTYLVWLRQFRRWFRERHPQSVTSGDVRNFLSFLAVKRRVASATQNQAFNSLLFFMRNCLKQDPKDLDGSVRAPVRRRLPVVLTRDEIGRVVAAMPEPHALMAKLAYGCGLRQRECLALRVKDVDFERGMLTVRAGKGNKDRQTVLPDISHVQYRSAAGARIRPPTPQPWLAARKISPAVPRAPWRCGIDPLYHLDARQVRGRGVLYARNDGLGGAHALCQSSQSRLREPLLQAGRAHHAVRY